MIKHRVHRTKSVSAKSAGQNISSFADVHICSYTCECRLTGIPPKNRHRP
jgi:hypothetical protein